MSFKAVDILGISALINYEEIFKQAGVDVELEVCPCPMGATEEEVIAGIGDADAAIVQASFQPFSRKVIVGLPKCRLLASVGVGCEQFDLEAATEYGILAANVPDASIEEVSDHTIGLILACTRRICQLDQAVKKGVWTEIAAPGIGGEIWPKLSRLRGQTLGLIGLGRIAQAVVPKAKAFGLRIVACDPFVPQDLFRQLGVEQVDLDPLLAQSDIVSIHTPLTSDTDCLMNMERLGKMKPGACLVNTARGAEVDHDALYEVLCQGHLSAAALDVTEPEPIPKDSPLLGMDSVVITAHSAGISPPAFTELQRRPALEVIRVVNGEWPVGLLNPEVKEKYRQRWA